MSALSIRFHRGGVFLPALGLWLDPHQPQSGPERVFISHAHSDHTGLHREVILSEGTSRLMRARLSGEWMEHVLPFGEPREFSGPAGDWRLTLRPAGHVFGSAMALVETVDGSLLYTGDFKLRAGLSAERCQPCPADILIMETTYGRPVYRFPPSQEVMQGIIRFCREALDHEETPVLLGYSLGKSQELLCGLADANLPIMLHSAIQKLSRIYEQFGQSFPQYEKYEAGQARGKVLLCPPSALKASLLRKMGPVRTAIITGWAVDPNCRFRYQADAAFALSDHADYPDLLEMVRLVNPAKVFTLHGFAAEFAQSLRDLGRDAQALSEEDQLGLPLAFSGGAASSSPAPTRPRAVVEYAGNLGTESAGQAVPGEPCADAETFQRFAETSSQIGATSRKLEKIRLLSEYLSCLAPDLLPPVTTWFTGHPFAPAQNKVLQLGWALIRDALSSVGKLDQAAFGQIYLKHSDLGETAHEILASAGATSSTLSLRNVQAFFEQIQPVRGPLAKLPHLVRVLQQCTALEAKYLVKVLTGDLRIGLKEGLVEEAIASAFGAALAEVKNANLLLGNIGETALLAQRRELGNVSLVPFRPLKYMLASPEPAASDVWERVTQWSRNQEAAAPVGEPLEPSLIAWMPPVAGPAPRAWVEDKYDGVRCQLHKVGRRVALFSRDLKEMTGSFLDIADRFQQCPHDFVLDGEIVAIRGNQVLPFSDLQKRLGRREADLFLGQEVPVQYIAFDLLWLDGRGFLRAPLQARRESLETILPEGFDLTRVTRVHSPEEIESAFSAARARGNEGLMIKDPFSVYAPGRRGLSWLKLKKVLATLDCVVVGAEYGHGKRKAVLSDYTFAVRDEESGELKTIGKAYSGLTDLEIAGLTRHFLARSIRQNGRYFEVKPETVLEIAFDQIQPSERHSSGLAMRFPRIVRIRRDKTIADIDTVASARQLVQRSQPVPDAESPDDKRSE